MFKHWPEIFNHDATLTSAVLDRLLHHAETVTTEGTQTVFAGHSAVRRSWGLVQGDAKLDLDPPTPYEDVLDHEPQ